MLPPTATLIDGNGNRTRITHPDSILFETVRDTLGRPYWLASDPAGGCYYSAYFPDGLPGSRSRCNGSATWVSRDGIGRLNGLGHYYGTGGTGDATWLYDHNPASQIRSVSRDNDSYAWTGHYAVNRAYATNGLNQYTAAGSATFGYDANGNLTSDGSRTYVYDIENRLVSATPGGTLAYDPLGRLYQITATDGTVTRFLYDGDALVGEYDAAGVMTARYVHWDGADVPVIAYTGAGAPLASPTYLHADHQGSIVAISGASGVSQINRYDEYGIPAATNAGRFQYTGQIWLAELGMYYYKARIYSPTLGRFLQTDPVGYQGGINLYGYTGNDPVNRVDPSGNDPSCPRGHNCPDAPLPSEPIRRQGAEALGPSRAGGPESGANSYQNTRTGETRVEVGRAAGHPVDRNGHREFAHLLKPRIGERTVIISHWHNRSERVPADPGGPAETRRNNAPSNDDQASLRQTGIPIQVIGPNVTGTLYRIQNQDRFHIDSGDPENVPSLRSQGIIIDPRE